MTIKELIKNIKKLEATESDGWDMCEEFNCCPGDDFAGVYNKALKDVVRLLKMIEKMGVLKK